MFRLIIVAVIAYMSFVSVAAADTKIGLLNMREALASSDSAVAFKDKVSKQFKKQELEVIAAGEDATKMKKRLENDAAIMSDSERNKLASDLETKIQEYKYLKGKLDKAYAEKQQEFFINAKPKLDKAIDAVVAEHNLDLLMPKEAALYAIPAMDYTDKIIDKLNQLD